MQSVDTLLQDTSRPRFLDFFSHYAAREQVSSYPSEKPKLPATQIPEKMTLPISPHKLDREQQLSAALQTCSSLEKPSSFASTSTSSIPPASQPAPVSSSPAALFLSAFSSPPVPQAPLPDAEGQVIAGYTFGNVIGYGGFSTIRRAYSTSGGIVAVKIVRRSDLSKQPNAFLVKKRLDHETLVWSSLSHEHILPLFSAVHTSYADYFFTLYCPAGSLFDILKRDGRPALPQDDAGMMFRQVVRGLRYMHEVAGYVHRDMKLENVLVDEMGVCRIGDFGMSCKIGEIDEEDENEEHADYERHPLTPSNHGVHRAASMAAPYSKRLTMLTVSRHSSVRHRNSTSSPHPTSRVFQPGSLPYAAPELISAPQAPDYHSPHPAQDIWALGVMLYTLLTGHLPFSDSFEPRLQLKICSGVYEIPADFGQGAVRVLKGCLERCVEDRWTIAMVDEVAWGIGWGTEGDDATPEDESEAEEASLMQSKTSRSCSRSRSYGRPEVTEESSGPHKEAASRRSSSRLKRSLSRAPVIIERTSGRQMNQSKSRQSRGTSPSLGGMSGSIVSSGSVSGSSICYSPSYESALLVSPVSSLERGRRRKKVAEFYPSRSPSPDDHPDSPSPTSPTLSFRPQVFWSSDHLRNKRPGSQPPAFWPTNSPLLTSHSRTHDIFFTPLTTPPISIPRSKSVGRTHYEQDYARRHAVEPITR
ncbi:hypothetical protein AMATHDRAFT_55340 [Amanita thiersii Skay4041]|uniref:Protein kinase domain-containing protein n=1 Tax=Amanita thiersii Skay4041 TaxID=703135 RepID=A0A2A9NZB2_9AGAR|nr:hypothetical protein AMATHDRAFT_55340 [Amanita thiersii Skay4041]